jgi:hypothetical protein
MARRLTGGWPPYRELLLARTPEVTGHTTRAAYAMRLLARVPLSPAAVRRRTGLL